MRKKTRMNLLPFTIAKRAPIVPPAALQKAIGIATANSILPVLTKKRIEPKLVERFTSLACALALRKSKPNKVMKAITRKLPAPGPIKPS